MNYKLIVFDLDGTLTDGKIYYIGGQRGKSYDVKNGMRIKELKKLGLNVNLLTGDNCESTNAIAKHLKFDNYVCGAENKIDHLRIWKERMNISWSQIIYVGDDINDLECMQHVGLKICPFNAAKSIKNICDFVIPEGEILIQAILEYLEK
jgi:YrbI family 3-deoxy-D-manno-octulosonate 8-phosphate phosphatase